MKIVDQEKLTRTKLIGLINNHRPFKINLRNSIVFAVHNHEVPSGSGDHLIPNPEFHLVDDEKGWLHLRFEENGSKLKEHGVKCSYYPPADPVESSKAVTKIFNQVVSKTSNEEE